MTSFRIKLFALLLQIVVLTVPGSLSGRVLTSVPDAISRSFKGEVTFKRERFFLSTQQAELFKIRAAGSTLLKSRIITRLTVYRGKKIAGYGYLDTHHVRSGRETLLVILSPKGKIQNTVLLTFQGDRGYEPTPEWLSGFTGLSIDKKIRLKHDIDVMSGASITSSEVVNAVQRVLILHGILTQN